MKWKNWCQNEVSDVNAALVACLDLVVAVVVEYKDSIHFVIF